MLLYYYLIKAIKLCYDSFSLIVHNAHMYLFVVHSLRGVVQYLVVKYCKETVGKCCNLVL